MCDTAKVFGAAIVCALAGWETSEGVICLDTSFIPLTIGSGWVACATERLCLRRVGCAEKLATLIARAAFFVCCAGSCAFWVHHTNALNVVCAKLHRFTCRAGAVVHDGALKVGVCEADRVTAFVCVDPLQVKLLFEFALYPPGVARVVEQISVDKLAFFICLW